MVPATLPATGSDVECMVLARAVLWHAQHRVPLDRNKGGRVPVACRATPPPRTESAPCPPD
jgi:hypothetical protein